MTFDVRTQDGKLISYTLPSETATLLPSRFLHGIVPHGEGSLQDRFNFANAWITAVHGGFDPRWREISSDFNMENV
jgi:hypothetical protein